MKNYLFFLSAICLCVFACTKNDVESTINTENLRLGIESNLVPSGATSGVINNGKWLKFSSEEAFQEVYNQLDEAIRNYDFDNRDGDDKGGGLDDVSFVDTEPVLAAWEALLGHESLRRKCLTEEYDKYNEGLHPSEVMPSIHDFGIVDEVYQACISKDGVIQIGSSIRIHRNGRITITTTNPITATNIVNNGNVAIFDPANIDDIEVHHNASAGGGSGGGGDAPECTAAFENTSQTETDEGVLASFVWGETIDQDCLDDLELEWDFGDGATMTDDDGIISHTYAEPGDYFVCLEVSWTFEVEDGDDVTCNDNLCQTITIEDNGPPCDEETLCLAINALSLLNPTTAGTVLIDSENSTQGNLCISTTGIINFLTEFCTDVNAGDIVFTCPDGTEIGALDCCETCDGPRNIGITIGNCFATVRILMNEVPGCVAGDSDTGWEWIEYEPGEAGISYRMRTLSKEDNGWPFSRNEVSSKMIRKEFVRDKWRRRRARIGLEHKGIVFGDQTCACDNQDNPNDGDFPNRRKYTLRFDEPIMDDLDGISNDCSEPWFTDYFVDGNTVGTGSSCD